MTGPLKSKSSSVSSLYVKTTLFCALENDAPEHPWRTTLPEVPPFAWSTITITWSSRGVPTIRMTGTPARVIDVMPSGSWPRRFDPKMVTSVPPSPVAGDMLAISVL